MNPITGQSTLAFIPNQSAGLSAFRHFTKHTRIRPISTEPPGVTAEFMTLGELEELPLRQGLVRFWGYTNEFAEAFSTPLKQLGNVLNKIGAGKIIEQFGGSANFGSALVSQGSYTAVYLYNLLDAFITGKKVYKESSLETPKERWFDTISHGLDAGIFQYFASVQIPATLISGIREAGDVAIESSVSGKPIEYVPHKPSALPKNTVTRIWNGFNDLFDKVIFRIPNGIFNDIFLENKWLHFNFKKNLVINTLAPAIKKLIEWVPPLKHFFENSKLARTWTPVAVAMALVPFAVKPIDHGVDKVLDWTYRPWVEGLKKKLFPQENPMDTHPKPFQSNQSSLPSTLTRS